MNNGPIENRMSEFSHALNVDPNAQARMLIDLAGRIANLEQVVMKTLAILSDEPADETQPVGRMDQQRG